MVVNTLTVTSMYQALLTNTRCMFYQDLFRYIPEKNEWRSYSSMSRQFAYIQAKFNPVHAQRIKL